MNKYKPEYMGRCIPSPDDTSKMTDFVQNKYDSFSKIYETCRDQSDNINDIKSIENDSSDKNELSVKISADNEIMDNIAKNIKDDDIFLQGDVLTARC